MSLPAAWAAGLTCMAVAALSACGGGGGPSTAATFKRGYAAERASLNAVSNQIGVVITGAAKSTDAQLTSQLGTLEPRYRAELDKLDALKPPANLQADFTAVRSAARVLDADLVKISDAVTAHSAAAAGAATRQLAADVPNLMRAADTMRRKLGLAASPGQ